MKTGIKVSGIELNKVDIIATAQNSTVAHSKKVTGALAKIIPLAGYLRGRIPKRRHYC